MNANQIPPLAAVLYSPGDAVETLLHRVALTLRARGVRVGGVLQHDLGAVGNDPCAMALEDLLSGERFLMTQALGSGSTACRLDPGALAQAAVVVRRALDEGVELVMFNKFGAQEVAGAGLRDEMGHTAASGVPLLTAVGERFLAQWRDFTGDCGSVLPCDEQRVLAWCEHVCGR